VFYTQTDYCRFLILKVYSIIKKQKRGWDRRRNFIG